MLTLIVIGFVAFLSINQIMLAILHSRPEVVVPKLEGLGLMDALNAASELNLSIKQDGVEFDETLPAGTILRQAPPSGMKVRAGRALQVVISKGGEAVFVPAIVGKQLAQAQGDLAVDGLQLGAVKEVFSLEVAAQHVVSQNPSSGTIVTRGALIDVEVSKGNPPPGAPIAPDFIGQRIGNARGWAEDVGVKVRMKEDVKAVGVSGTVVKQRPRPGQPLLPGEALEITVVPLLASSQGFRLSYEVPKGDDEVVVRIVARDNRGESEVYQGIHAGGTTVEIPMEVTSTTRVRVYVDDILKDERVVEP